MHRAHAILHAPSKIRTSRLFLSPQPSNFVSTDLDKLGTNVRQPFLKILIGSAMASRQRRSNEREKLKELYLLENKQNKNAPL